MLILVQALCLISMGVGRAVAILPCVAIPNIMRVPARRIGAAMQVQRHEFVGDWCRWRSVGDADAKLKQRHHC